MQRENSASTGQFWTICRRVYLVWAIIVFTGFSCTHYFQVPAINWLWFILSLLGLGFMFYQLFQQTHQPQWQDPGLSHLTFVGLAWTLTIALGMIISVVPFMSEGILTNLSLYLGAFWLLQMGLGHILNGVVDPPRGTYILTRSMQYGAGVLCLFWPMLQSFQYLVAGVTGALAMLLLIVWRR